MFYVKYIFVCLSFYAKCLLKNKRAVSASFAVPLVFLLAAGMIGSQFLKKETGIQLFQIAIVNHDPTVETKLVIKQLTGSRHLNILMKTIQTNEKNAVELLYENEVAAVITIPKGFSKDVARGINTPVEVVGNIQRPLQAQLVRHLIESAADFTSAAQSGINTLYYFMEEAELSSTKKEKEFRQSIISFSLHILGRGEVFDEKQQQSLFHQNVFQYYILSFYVLLTMIWSFTTLLLLKTPINNFIQLRLLSRGVSSIQIMLAKAALTFCFVFVCSIVTSIPILVLIDFPSLATVSRFFVGTLLSVLLFSSFFIFIEAIMRTVKSYQVMGCFLILIGSVTGGHFIPTLYFPGWAEWLNTFSLNARMLHLMVALIENHPANTALSLALIVFLLSVCWMSSALFILKRRQEKEGYQT